MSKVDEVAEYLYKWYQGGCNWVDLSESVKERYRKDARQIDKLYQPEATQETSDAHRMYSGLTCDKCGETFASMGYIPKLCPKCQPDELIRDEEIGEIIGSCTEWWQIAGRVAKAQLAHCTPIIEKNKERYLHNVMRWKTPHEVKGLIEQGKKDTYRDIGEILCCLIGNLMLEDMEAGKKFAGQLEGMLKYCQTKAGIIFKGADNDR